MELNNYQADYAPKTVLFKEEVDAITEVISETLGQIRAMAGKSFLAGSFLLVEQWDRAYRGRTVVKFDYPEGPLEHHRGGRSSDQVMYRLAEEALAAEKNTGGYVYLIEDVPFDDEVLLLDATGGRFICATCMDYPYCEVDVYLAVAKALAMLRPKDEILQASYRELLYEEVSDDPNLQTVDAQVEDLFKRYRNRTMAAWKKWHDATKAAGELPPLFFV